VRGQFGTLTFAINESAVAAAVAAKALAELKAAAVAAQGAAKAHCHRRTDQLHNSIHVIEPGTTDDSYPVTDKDGRTFDAGTGITAGPTEAYVVARTFNHSGQDYAWYHHAGTSITPANGYMDVAAEAARAFPNVEVGAPFPVNEWQ